MKASMAAVFVFALALCGCDQSQPIASTPSMQDAGAASAPTTPPPLSHNYAMEENGEYGYEQGLTEDDIKAGTAAKPLAMVRYLGEIDGAYIVSIRLNEAGTVNEQLSCEVPCDFAKDRIVSGTTALRTQTIPVAPDSLAFAMLFDAINGQLRPYKKVSNAAGE